MTETILHKYVWRDGSKAQWNLDFMHNQTLRVRQSGGISILGLLLLHSGNTRWHHSKDETQGFLDYPRIGWGLMDVWNVWNKLLIRLNDGDTQSSLLFLLPLSSPLALNFFVVFATPLLL